MYRPKASTVGKGRGAMLSLKNLWRMRPPPTGPIARPGGGGTVESHARALAARSMTSGGSAMSEMNSMTKYTVMLSLK